MIAPVLLVLSQNGIACPTATASSGSEVDGIVASPELLASMFASVSVVEPGALHDPLTIATECDEFASKPMRSPESVEFAPEMFVMRIRTGRDRARGELRAFYVPVEWRDMRD